jgi:hypothetical protein
MLISDGLPADQRYWGSRASSFRIRTPPFHVDTGIYAAAQGAPVVRHPRAARAPSH